MRRIHFDYIKQVTEIPRLFMLERFKNHELKIIPKKILIINTSLIGDIVVSFPAISQFIKNNNSAKIDLVVTSSVKTLAQKIRGINKVYGVRSISKRKIESEMEQNEKEELLKTNYDLVIVLRLSNDAYKLLKKIKYKAIHTTFKSYTKYVKDMSTKNTTEPVKQVKDFYFDALNEKIKNVSFNKMFDIKTSEYIKIKTLTEIQGKSKKIIIHTGSGWTLKHLENEKWIEVIKKINKLGDFKFIFIGGEQIEEEDFNFIQKNLDFKIYSLISKIDIKDLFYVMRLSDYFIGIDSGPRNMSYVADLPSIGLVGPGTRLFMPFKKRDIIINKSDCNFCSASFCIRKKTCIEKITVEDIFLAFKKLSNL